MSNFHDARKAALLRVILNTDHFAEEVTYLPAGGGRQTITVLVRSARAQLRERETDLVEIEEIDVRASNDPAAEIDGVARGGIARPGLGDGLLRAGEEKPFSYAFTIESAADSWLLHFERRTQKQIGTAQMQRS